MATIETEYVKKQFLLLGRQEKLNLLLNSNLNDRELDLLIKRFVNGISLKECSDNMGMEVNSVSKIQQRAVRKLYIFINQ